MLTLIACKDDVIVISVNWKLKKKNDETPDYNYLTKRVNINVCIEIRS